MTRRYRESTDYLFSRQARGMKLGLENIRRFLELLGNPEKSVPCIHIAGTNGKGSTAAILASVLKEAGYRTGLYTSPHLIDMRERIRIDHRPISAAEVTRFIDTHRPAIEGTGVSFFEILTGMALDTFQKASVDIAVLETGLGGRLDATNLTRPLMTLITEIGLDHTRILGKTLEAVAREKAGILKPGIPCLCGVTAPALQDLFTRLSRETSCPIDLVGHSVRIEQIRATDRGTTFRAVTRDRSYEDLHLRLPGLHQVHNAAMVLRSVDFLRARGWTLSDEALRRGLTRVRWPARLDVLSRRPLVLLDSAHNPLGMRSLVQALKLFSFRRMILLFGVLEDKDYRTMTRLIFPLAHHIVLTRPLSHRALEPDRLHALHPETGGSRETIPDIARALKRAVSLAEKEDLVCIAGSIYLAGEIIRLWKNKPAPPDPQEV